MGSTQLSPLALELLSIIDRRIAEVRKAKPKLDYASAWTAVTRARPDLLSTYNKAARADQDIDFRDDWKLVASEQALASLVSKLAAALVPIEEQIYLAQQKNPEVFVSYAQAWSQVEKTHPALIDAYNKAAGHPPGATTEEILARNQALIDQYVRNLRQAEPQLLYPAAMARAEKERPDLFWRLKDAAGRKHATPSSLTAPIEAGAFGAQVSLSANPLAAELAAIDEEIARRRTINPQLGYALAWQALQRERPELIRSYNEAASRMFVGGA